MNLEQILKQASEYELDYGLAAEFARSQNLSLVEFANLFAVELAKGYQKGFYDFAFSDGAVNWLFAFMTDDVFTNEKLPSPAYDIYLAFDDGEYLHKGDPDDIVPEDKYTKPRINEILSTNYS